MRIIAWRGHAGSVNLRAGTRDMEPFAQKFAAAMRRRLIRDLHQSLQRLDAESRELAPQAQRGRALLGDDLRRAIETLSAERERLHFERLERAPSGSADRAGIIVPGSQA